MSRKKGTGRGKAEKTGREIKKNYKGLISSEEALLKLLMLAVESYRVTDRYEKPEGGSENES